MRDRGLLKLEFCLSLSVAVLVFEVLGADVRCGLVKAKNGSSHGVLCSCYAVEYTPWPAASVVPAAHPDNATVIFTGTMNRMHACIQWAQKASYLRDVNGGFYLELSIEHNLNYYYNCDVQVSEIDTANEKEIWFHFNECCTSLENGSGWKAGAELTVIVHSLPMSNVDDEVYYALTRAKVPERPLKSKHKRKRGKERLISKRKRSRAKLVGMHRNGKQAKAKPGDEPLDGKIRLLTVLACICTVSFTLMLAAFVTVLHIRMRWRHQCREVNHNLLIIGNSGDSHIHLVNELMEIVRKYGLPRVKVTTNMWLNLIVMASLLCKGSSGAIWCSQTKQSRKAICNCVQVSSKPWSSASEVPAPKPLSISLSYFIFKMGQRSRIGVNVSWVQKGSDFDADYNLEGYYIEISEYSSDPRRYRCNLSNLKINAATVKFHFRETLHPPNPGTFLMYEISPIPLYTEDHKPSLVAGNLSIPECHEDESIKEVSGCIEANVESYKTTASTQSKRDRETRTLRYKVASTDQQPAAIMPISTLTVPVLLFFCVAAYMKLIEKRKVPCFNAFYTVSQKILLVVDDEDQESIKVANEFAEFLQLHGRMEVTTNARRTVEIGDIGIVKWMEEAVKEADVVVMLAGSEQENSKLLPSNVATRCVEPSQNKLITVNVTRCRNGVFRERSRLRRDSWKAALHVIGTKLASMVSEKSNTDRCGPEVNYERPEGVIVQNDLDCPSNNVKAPTPTWNVTVDDQPSRDSNL